MKISLVKLLIRFSVVWLTPLVPVYGQVFYCPQTLTAHVEKKGEQILWTGSIRQAPENIPDFLKTLTYRVTFRMNKLEAGHLEYMGPNLQFLRAYYRGKSDGPRYGCVYTNRGAISPEVVMSLYSGKIPGTSRSLLVETYGIDWTKTEDGTCKIRKRCGFRIPKLAVQNYLDKNVSVPMAPNEGGINLTGLYDGQGNPFNMTLAYPITEGHRFRSDNVFQKPEVTRLLIHYPGGGAGGGTGGKMEMFHFLRANGLQQRVRPDCDFTSRDIEVCDCTEKNVREGIQSDAHLLVNSYQKINEHKVIQAASCDLYSIPVTRKQGSLGRGHHQEL